MGKAPWVARVLARPQGGAWVDAQVNLALGSMGSTSPLERTGPKRAALPAIPSGILVRFRGATFRFVYGDAAVEPGLEIGVTLGVSRSLVPSVFSASYWLANLERR